MRAQMIQRQFMLTVLMAAVVGSARSAEAQRYCDAPVPGFRNRSEVALYESTSKSAPMKIVVFVSFDTNPFHTLSMGAAI